MLEALSCGKPVITNKLGSVFDIWIDEKFNGKTVELNAEKWASEILKIINIPKKNLQILIIMLIKNILYVYQK